MKKPLLYVITFLVTALFAWPLIFALGNYIRDTFLRFFEKL